MKPLHVVLVALAGAVLGGGGIYWYDANTRAELNLQLDDLRRQAAAESLEHVQQLKQATAKIDELNRRLEAAESKPADAERKNLEAEIARLRTSLEATQRNHVAAQAALAKAEARVAELTGAPTAATAIASTTPLEVADEAAARSNMARRFAPLIQKLGLSQADADRFVGLMVSRQRAADDVLAATRAAGDGTATIGGVTDMVGSTLAGVDSDLHALLGDTGYAQLKNFQASLTTTGTVSRLQANLANSAPLNDAQVQQLQQMLADTGVGHLTPVLIDKARAAGFLSPEQLQAVQALYQQQRAAQLRRRTGVSTTPGP